VYGLLCLNTNCLNFSEQNIAKAHYCGLCNSLSSNYGFTSRTFTNHDATFISILHSAQSKNKISPQKCPLKLQKTKPEVNTGLEYASAISLIMAKAKIDDNILDQNSYISRVIAGKLDSKIPSAINELKRLGFKLQTITSEIKRQKTLESQHCSDLNELVSPTENAVSEICSHTATLTGKTSNFEPLSILGKNIGRLMYLTDNYVDFTSDFKKTRFNALSNCYPHANQTQIKKTIGKQFSQSINEISTSIKNLTLNQHQRIVGDALLYSLKQRLENILHTKPKTSPNNIGLTNPFSLIPKPSGSARPHFGAVRCIQYFEYFCNC
jgi:hypothetical protein